MYELKLRDPYTQQNTTLSLQEGGKNSSRKETAVIVVETSP